MSIGETFSRSWDITKKSFKVIKADKEILIFPVLASVFSIIFFLLMVVPFLMTGLVNAVGGENLSQAAFYLVLFIFVLWLSGIVNVVWRTVCRTI